VLREEESCCEECPSLLLFPFHCWVMKRESLCTTAFCSGITGLYALLSRFTVGQEFHLLPVSLLGKS